MENGRHLLYYSVYLQYIKMPHGRRLPVCGVFNKNWRGARGLQPKDIRACDVVVPTTTRRDVNGTGKDTCGSDLL